MKYVTVMLKPASSLCNMRCKYCFYADVSSLRQVRSFGMMTQDTARRVIANIFTALEPGDHVTLSFQGGEPTLAGLEFYRFFVNTVTEHANGRIGVSYTLQTNGYLIDEDWCAFLKEHDFLVGLSLDGAAVYHDANRVDAAGEGTFKRIMSTKTLFDRYGVAYNILSVLTRELARHPRQVWSFLLEQNIRYVQFIPCLGSLEEADDVHALTPERYGSFYSQLFPLWLEQYKKGNYISVKLFDDLINLLAFGQCNACGLMGFCHAQIIVEADGSVYPCDFYVLDQYRVGSLAEQPLHEIMSDPAMDAFQRRQRREQPLCSSCRYQKMCRGGCQRMTGSVFYDPKRRVCGHQKFLDQWYPQLEQLAILQRRHRGR